MMKVNIQHRCWLLLCRLHVKTTCSPLDSACSLLVTRLTGELSDRHNVLKSAAQERCILEKGKKKKLHDSLPLQPICKWNFFCRSKGKRTEAACTTYKTNRIHKTRLDIY